MRQVLVYTAFLAFGFSVKAQSIPFLNVDGGESLAFFGVKDFKIPNGVLQIEFEAIGADGGNATFANNACAAPGGKGAVVKGIAIVGNSPGQIPPGSTIRFIPGEAGEISLVGAGASSSGGGGGGSAIMFKSSTMFTFEPICVAGGGGGASQGNFFGLCTDHAPGLPGQGTQNGGNGNGPFAGLGGNNLLGGSAGLGGGGGGSNGDGGGFFCGIPADFTNPIGGGEGSWEQGGIGGNSEFCSVTPGIQRGGDGYGGGGGGQVADLFLSGAGGGGGYCGGGGGGSFGAGGGGGSYLMSGLLFPSIQAGGSNPDFNHHLGFTSYRCITDTLEAGQNLYSDFIKPVARCKDITVFLNDIGTLHLFPEQMDNGSTDSSPITFSSSRTALNCSHINQVLTISMFVKDIAGNTSSCQSQVAVLDNKPPLLQCKPKTLFLNANGTINVLQADVVESAADNCGATSLQITPNAFNCSHLGPNLVTVVAKDASNNSTNCSSTVTVVDAMPPTVVCKSFTANLNTAGITDITTADVFQSGLDNCGIVNQVSVVPNSFVCTNLGANVVKFTANDGHGNTNTCSAVVTVADPITPTMRCKSVTISLNSSGAAILSVPQINDGSFDNCAITQIGLDRTLFNCSNIGLNTVILGGIDASGNKGQCTATVNVVDQILPKAKCKSITANLGANGTVTVAGAFVNNGSSDNCSFTLDLSPNTFGCENVGQNTVTLKATDAGGNTASCSAKVTVKDVSAPLAMCKNTTILLNDQGLGLLSANQVDNGSSDNCGIQNRVLNRTQFDCSDLGETPWPVVLTLRDAFNNLSSCTAQIMVKDQIPPIAQCENTTVTLEANGKVTVFGAILAQNSTDNCSVWTYTPHVKVYTSANLGDNTLNITVKDQSGNSASCTSMVTVLPFSGMRVGEDRDEYQEDIPTDLNLRLFPNPAEELVTLAFDLPSAQEFRLLVFDLTGRLVLSKQAMGLEGANALVLPLEKFASGIYLVDFQTEVSKTQKRLLIQK